MLATLAQSDHAIQKSSQVYRMNLLEQENYETLNKQIGMADVLLCPTSKSEYSILLCICLPVDP
jgi:hypothetical protein